MHNMLIQQNTRKWTDRDAKRQSEFEAAMPTTMNAVLLLGHGGFEQLVYRSGVQFPRLARTRYSFRFVRRGSTTPTSICVSGGIRRV